MLTLADIRTQWPWVKEGLEKVKEKCGETWRPEDVYAACVYGNAVLYTSPDGFLVFQPMKDEYTLEPYLHIWIAYGLGETLVKDYDSEVVRIAKTNNYEKITFKSPRRGWEKLSDWKVKTVTYEREI